MTDTTTQYALVDLFAGVGGITAGFLREGFELEKAVDADRGALSLLGSNAGATREHLQCTTLHANQDWTANAQLPAPRKGLHVHSSTPCQLMSRARQTSDAAELAEGLALFRTALELPLRRGDATWSLEQVPHRHAIELVEAFAAALPSRVAFTVLDAADLGSPSARKRLIVGDPKTTQALKNEPARRTSIHEAFDSYGGLHVPNGAVAIGVGRGVKVASKRRSLADTAPTVCASHPLTWFGAEGDSRGVLTPRHSAALMQFAKGWRLPSRQREAQRAVGNAVPISLSRAMARAARAAAGEPLAPIPQTTLAAIAVVPAAPTAAPTAAPVSAKRGLEEIVGELEGALTKASKLLKEVKACMGQHTGDAVSA